MAHGAQRHADSLRRDLTERACAVGRQTHERPITGDSTPYGDLGPWTRLFRGAQRHATRHRPTPSYRLARFSHPALRLRSCRRAATSASGRIAPRAHEPVRRNLASRTRASTLDYPRPCGRLVSPRNPPIAPTRTISAPLRRGVGPVLNARGSGLPVGARRDHRPEFTGCVTQLARARAGFR
jgi:hypothetical protein